MTCRVLIPQDISEAGKTFLRDKGYDIVMGSAADVQTLKEEVRDCHAVLARTGCETDGERTGLIRERECEFVQCVGSSFDLHDILL